MTEGDLFNVEVAFAMPGHQEIIAIEIPCGSTAIDALNKSGIREKFPDVNFEELGMGIFSRPLNGIDLPAPQDYVLEENDRVEIYRPLEKDPKQARLERAQKKRQKKQQD